ncbi:hypothetical protein Acr_00g0079180 [Actinidia rufa]|uniref:Fasciclin-like arabinogalactan family protein n=1 Tax=Actinidia rufa TaxID=165716 RepID=A0A7J0DUB9_9ERIC|nr:hypothetical protein Acr_00g0079180 [Actinidia rufa]
MAYSKFLFSLFLFVLLLQTIPSSSRLQTLINYPRDDFFGYSLFVPRPRDYGNLFSDPLSKALYEAGYHRMSWITLEKLIPAIRSHFGHDGAITIFAPTDEELNFYPVPTKFLQQVVPMRLDREALKNFPINSTIPNFHPLEHLKVTQPLMGVERTLRSMVFRSRIGKSTMMGWWWFTGSRAFFSIG